MLDIQDNHDGYHTFKELYLCRHALLMVVANSNKNYFKKSIINNHYDGWFLVGANLPNIGQVSFHLPNEFYNDFKLDILKDDEWIYDGHTTPDVISRFLSFAKTL